MNELEVLLSFIKRFEGCHLKAYYCPAGVLTIGWGTTGGITPTTVWTQGQADERLMQDAKRFMAGAKLLLPNATGGVLVACSDFAYNLGLGRLKTSTLRKKILLNDLTSAKAELLRWDKAGGRVLKGLTLRRKAESSLF
jgi:lysozyme